MAGHDDDTVADVDAIAIVGVEIFLIGEADVVADMDILVNNRPLDVTLFPNFIVAGGVVWGGIGFVAQEDGFADDGSFPNHRTDANNAVCHFFGFEDSSVTDDRIDDLSA